MTERRLTQAVRPVVPLLAGVFLLMAANGLQASLVALRASAEGFGTTGTGLVSSAYFAGFLLGAGTATAWIRRVGHVRAFGALASIASMLVLVHVLAVTLPVWIVARLLSGACVAGLLVIIESWLNRAVGNDTRGTVLSLYMVVTTLGYVLGQFLLAAAPVESFTLFAVVSVLLSSALLPVILSRRSQPTVAEVAPLPVAQLARRSPGGVVASAMAGLTWGAIVGWAAIIASRIGLRGLGVTAFVSAFLVGHLVFEPVVGWLSDRIDRRAVLTGVSGAAAVASVAAAAMSGESAVTLMVLAAVIGGTTLPLYGLSLSLAADRLEPEEMVAAAGTLVRINGAGAAVGPMLVAQVSAFGVAGYFGVVAGGTAATALLGAALLVGRGAVTRRRTPHWTMVGRGTAILSSAAMRATARRRRPVAPRD